MLGIKTISVIYKEMVNSYLSPALLPKRPQLGTVKSMLKIPPRHNGIVPIKISGPSITTHTAHFIADDSTHKGKDPTINIIEGIHKIKDRSTVNVIVSNYSNKHLTFHKDRYISDTLSH